MLTLAAAGGTDIGRVRQRNEDSFVMDEERQIFIVCDGMGGHAAGNVASEEAAKEGRRFLKERLTDFEEDPPQEDDPPEREQLLNLARASVQKACAHVYNMAMKNPDLSGMGTTMTGCFFRGARGYVGHVGDSRLWLVREGVAHPLTEDHRVVAELMRKGAMTAEEAKEFPFPNSLSRSVGVHPIVEVDAIDFDVLEGDRILICSDGLHEYLRDEQIASMLTDWDTIEGAPQSFIDYANAKGGGDNITAVCIHVVAVGDAETTVSVDTLKMMEFIQRMPIFEDLDFRELTTVLNHTKTNDFQAGDEVLAAGAERTGLQVVLYGQLQIERSERPVADIGPGGPIGESSFLGSPAEGVSVQALEVSRTLRIDADELEEVIKADPRTGAKLMAGLARALARRLDDVRGPTS